MILSFYEQEFHVMLDSYIGSLLKYLHQLDSLFRDTKVISALTCVIPPVENGCDDIGKCIEPVVNWGPHAYTSVISCWQDLYISPLYSQKFARRTAGYVQLSTEAMELADHLIKINTVKNNIRSTIVALPKSERFTILRKHLSNVMTLHLYRNIPVFNSDDVITHASYTWGLKGLMQKTDPVKLYQLIADIAKGNAELQDLMDKIQECPANRLRIKRSVTPQPICNLTFASGKKRCINAPVPFLIVQDKDFKVSPLPLFTTEADRQERSDKHKTTLLGVFRGQQIIKLEK